MQAALELSIRSYDLVHVHSVYLWPTNMAARCAHAADVPYVVSPRGMLVPELVAMKSSLIKSAWLTWIESETLAHAARVHMTSTRELQDARRLALPLPSPCIVPNGVRGPEVDWQSEVSTRVHTSRSAGPYVLFLGRVHWKKGLPLTLRALAGTDMQLVICGPDDEGYTPELLRIAQDAGVADQVRFEQEVRSADKWALLAGARCVVLASDNENFGNVVPEAMWMGVPLVVSDHTGASDIVQAADCGFVCPREEHALRQALMALWNEPSQASTLGENGRLYAQRELTWTAVARRMAEHYGKAIVASS
jgi:glycosyltransferase involved in cell wall biosynthesis